MDTLKQILDLVAGLVGFPALLAVLINIAKYFGLPDGSAPAVNVWAHMIVYVAVGVAVILGKVDLLPGIDLALSNVANVLLAVLALLTSIGVAKLTHVALLRGLPLIGYFHRGY
jgi:hypothetical protein